jgi:hypothetical protein
MPTALVLCQPEHERSRTLAFALAQGLAAHDYTVTLNPAWSGRVEHDLVAAYGWCWASAFQAHPAFFYGDLGWWRRERGHHRLLYKARAPDLSGPPCQDDRWRRLRVRVLPWRTPSAIRPVVLVSGMSAKAAATWGLRSQEWEQTAIDRLRFLACHVLYRPKGPERALPGAQLVDHQTPIEQVLRHVDATVSHGSGVAIDALVAGIPAYQETDQRWPWALSLKTLLEMREPADRAQALHRLAYRQWTPAELATGLWLRYYPASIS